MTRAMPGAKQVYVFAASHAQRSLWFLDQLAPGSPFYNVHVGIRVRTTVDAPALERSINEIVRRHESLRTVFKAVDGEPVQVVAPRLDLALPVTDLRHLQEAEREAAALRIADDEAQTQFDLSRWPLVRAGLVVLAAEESILLLTLHHIVCDFWSLEVFREELSALYEAFCRGQPSPLPELSVQYADFAEWERKWLRGPAGQSQLDYWKRQLADIAVPQLPTDRPRPQVSSFAGAEYDFELPASVHAPLLALAQQERVTLFMVTLAALQTLLHRYTGQDDIVVGTPAANRNRPEVENLIGFFVNSLVLRADLSGDPRFRDLLARVRTVALDAYAHQEVPFEKLVSELRPERGLGHNPLFQVHFQLLGDGPQKTSDPLAGEPLRTETSAAKFDLALDLWEYPDGLWGHLEYSTDLFSEETIARLERHFRRLLRGIAANPDQRLSELPLLDEDERHELVVEWNDTRADHSCNTCLHQLFEVQVEKSPDATALTFRDEHLSYRELNRRANQLAHHLRSLGAKPETLVAICAERSLEMIVGILGILKAGAAYLPLNPSDPPARMQWILEDAHPRVLLTQHRLLETVPAVAPTSVCLDMAREQLAGYDDQNPAVELPPESIAYVIYTSGSTGTPRGVLSEHQAVCDHLLWMQSAFPLHPTDRVLQKYSFNFDASVCEIFGPLLAGARLILGEPSPHWDAARFVEVLDEQQVTVLDLVPSMLEVLLAEPSFSACGSLRRVISGGETLRPELRDRFFGQLDAELHNIYGPTEATIGATWWTCLPEHAGDSVPIGRPAANTKVYILDPHLNPVPVGVRGELHIGGAGLARGYLNRGDLTAERFIPDPFSGEPGARMYKTGDVARYLPDGVIEYAGRVDDQIKLRGHRVEPGEIERALAGHESVQACSVIAVQDERHHSLIAYVNPTPDPPELWPSLGEHDVYDELLYAAMTRDERRNRAFRAAIDRAVAGKVVVDLGTGADALLARFCVKAGADRVYAVEASHDAFQRAEDLVQRLALTDRITVMYGDSTEVELPELVDVCVSEILGTIGSSEGAVSVLNDARRFLKDNGTMIPRRCVTRIAPVSLPASLTGGPLQLGDLPGLYVRRVFEKAGHPFDLRLCIKGFPREQLLAQSQVFEELAFSGLLPPEDRRRVRFTIDRASRLDGFLLWINLYAAEDDHPLDSLHQRLSWLPVFFPVFHPALDVLPGDVIEAECARTVGEGGRKPDYRLEGTVERADGRRVTFAYRSAWRTSAFKASSFYDSLFTNMDGQLVRAGNGTTFPGLDDAHRLTPYGSEGTTLGLAPRLRRFLQEQLPEYLIPSSFVVVDELPRTSSGKLDRRALAALGSAVRTPGVTYAAPTTEAEQIIAATWRDVLGLGQIGVHDNFFDSGGDSLLITQILSRLKPLFDREISIIDLFRYPTISALAEHLEDRGETEAATLKAAQNRARRQRGAIGQRRPQPR